MADKGFEKLFEASPSLTRAFETLVYRSSPGKMQFPNGLKYRYYGKFALFTGVWAFCYSTTRNANGKYVSWVYQPIVGKKRWKVAKILENRKMKDAKARALRMHSQHEPIQTKYQALWRKSQRKGAR